MRVSAVILVLCLMLVTGFSTAWAIVPPSDPDPLPLDTRPTTPAPATPVDGIVVGSIEEALDLADGALIILSGKIVVATQADMGGNFFYVEEDSRATGIRVSSAVTVSRGDRVSVIGVLSVANGERFIDVDSDDPSHSVQVLSSGGTSPEPLGMDNPTVGGASLNTHTPGTAGATGPYNRGLLIRTWGSVSAVGTNWFYIDDGSFLFDYTGDGNGIKVATNCSPPSVGDYVVVTGMSSSFEYPTGSIRPLVRARDSADIDVVTENDRETVTAPTSVICRAGYHFLSLPCVPVNSAATSVFAQTITSLPDDTLTNNLVRWDTAYPQDFGESYIWYLEVGSFGPLYPGEGYWLKTDTAGALSYAGIGAPARTTDMYIKLAPEGWTMIGYPYGHPNPAQGRLLGNMYATDGHRMLTLREASWDAHWISTIGYWWDSATQGLNDVGLLEDYSSCNALMPWHGYWIYSYTRHDQPQRVALVIPSPGADSLSLTASDQTVPPGGTSTITARLTSRSGVPLEGTPVAFSTTAGVLGTPTPDDSRTYSDGRVNTVLSDLSAGEIATITATVVDVSGQVITAQVQVGTERSAPVVTDDGEFTTSASTLHAGWSTTDSGITEYRYAIGTAPGSTSVVAWTSAGTATEVTRTDLSLIEGSTYYFSVKTLNSVGVWSPEGYSDGISVNTGPPTFSNLMANPSIAGIGTAVVISFAASEALSVGPTVTVNGHTASTPTQLGNIYSCSYIIQSADPEGPAGIHISGTDRTGSSGELTNSTALTVVAGDQPVVVTAPINGATVATPCPTIVWAGQAHDMFEVHIGTNPTDPVLSVDGWDSGQVTSSESTAVPAVFLTEGTTYYVYVREHRTSGWSLWSAPGHAFTVSLQRPSTPGYVPYCQ